MRSAGLHFQLRTAAFKMRNEWATVLPPGDRASWPMDPDALALTQRMRTEAIQRRVANLHFLPHWGERWWIE